MEKFKLKTQIMIDGNMASELPYDFDGLTARDKLNAGKKLKAAGFNGTYQEVDPDYHFFIFVEAVIKADSNITEQDMFRMGMKDAVEASNLVRNFFFITLEDSSQTTTSEEQQPK